MKALTIWQPWASLIMIGAKPIEFRKWDYRTREPGLVDQRIVIHAGSRPIKPSEVEALLSRIAKDDPGTLIPGLAVPLLQRLLNTPKCRGVLDLSAALGTAKLGKPRSLTGTFQKPDSDRFEHHMWAWPLTELERFPAPITIRGFQGFWNFPEPAERMFPRSMATMRKMRSEVEGA